ncbi:zinc finger protein-domain-containing protein [Apiospora arundinis]|uniref:Zinc finger protein-domain-containing protein n=1 Tax=Apiospora arundinis TaxID=335852 RepID=A0ABR2IHN3_9PEZI
MSSQLSEEDNAFKQECRSNQLYRKIGDGTGGTVWSSLQGSTAIKRRSQHVPREWLQNDYQKHRLILQSLEQCPRRLVNLAVPKCHAFIPRTYPGWEEDQRFMFRFPDRHLSYDILITERIPPMPDLVRQDLIENYSPKYLKKEEKQSLNQTEDERIAEKMAKEEKEKNQNCLIRPYLVPREDTREGPLPMISGLRNVPLDADQLLTFVGTHMVRIYAFNMAWVLATLHWIARVDASGIEFVLALPRQPPPPPSIHEGPYCLWLLDFDKCRTMSMDQAGVEQAAQAFQRNDPYYPRPGNKAKEL